MHSSWLCTLFSISSPWMSLKMSYWFSISQTDYTLFLFDFQLVRHFHPNYSSYGTLKVDSIHKILVIIVELTLIWEEIIEKRECIELILPWKLYNCFWKNFTAYFMILLTYTWIWQTSKKTRQKSLKETLFSRPPKSRFSWNEKVLCYILNILSTLIVFESCFILTRKPVFYRAIPLIQRSANQISLCFRSLELPFLWMIRL